MDQTMFALLSVGFGAEMKIAPEEIIANGKKKKIPEAGPFMPFLANNIALTV